MQEKLFLAACLRWPSSVQFLDSRAFSSSMIWNQCAHFVKIQSRRPEQMAQLMGCLLQLWYILASFVTWYMIEPRGRCFLLASMAIGICAMLVLQPSMLPSMTPTQPLEPFDLSSHLWLGSYGLDGLHSGVLARGLAAEG